MAKGIRRRMQRMIAVERRYFNRPGGLSALIGITLTLQIFTIMFCVFYMLSRPISAENQSYVVASAVLVVVFIAIFIAFKIACGRFGLTYSLFMGMSSACYVTAAVAGYLSFRCMWSWHFSDIIRDAVGYQGVLNDIVKTCLLIAAGILVVYIGVAFIPAKKTEPIFGRLWFLNILVPLFSIGFSLVVLLMTPREGQLQAANWVCTGYFIVVLWLAIRYAVKAVFYGITENDRKETLIEDLKQEEEPSGEKDDQNPKREAALSAPLKKQDVIESIQKNLDEKTTAKKKTKMVRGIKPKAKPAESPAPAQAAKPEEKKSEKTAFDKESEQAPGQDKTGEPKEKETLKKQKRKKIKKSGETKKKQNQETAKTEEEAAGSKFPSLKETPEKKESAE